LYTTYLVSVYTVHTLYANFQTSSIIIAIKFAPAVAACCNSYVLHNKSSSEIQFPFSM